MLFTGTLLRTEPRVVGSWACFTVPRSDPFVNWGLRDGEKWGKFLGKATSLRRYRQTGHRFGVGSLNTPVRSCLFRKARPRPGRQGNSSVCARAVSATLGKASSRECPSRSRVPPICSACAQPVPSFWERVFVASSSLCHPCRTQYFLPAHQRKRSSTAIARAKRPSNASNVNIARSLF